MTGDTFGPKARNSLGEMICLNCGVHKQTLTGSEVTCSVNCRMQLWRRGGRMDWRTFRLRVAALLLD